MDPASIHYSSAEDHHTLSHDGLHHPSRPPPPHTLRIGALASHSSLDLPYDSHNSIYQHHLHQRLDSIPTLPVVHADYTHHSQDGYERRAPLPSSTPSSNLLRQPSTPHPGSDLQSPSHLTAPGHHHHLGTLGSNAPLPTSQRGGVLSAIRTGDGFTGHGGPTSMRATGLEPQDQRSQGRLVSRIVIDPPNLRAWREKLFNVDDTITLSNDEFETYFPHIDNVYSHRSTQKYKRKNFISHYWDCRMKGRPPGTPKSDDPTKKKRKRLARERDLCDVKIKITEYFPGATYSADGTINHSLDTQQLSDGTGPLLGFPAEKKYWTIQRVNGNGGNGKGDGVPGPHKHTLEKSDEIKKSSVQRYLASIRKEAKKGQVPQKRPSGNALVTARKHSKDDQLKLYAASFCPFSQRVWIALEAKGMSYQYCETDPFKRPTQLLEANPRGLVPAIKQGDWASGESTVILEYLEDHDRGVPLLPTDPRLKANCRLWIDHINAKIVPAFFSLMRAGDSQKQAELTDSLQSEIVALVQAADERGPYFLGKDLCLVDVHLAPFVLRLSRILRGLRSWRDPMPGTRWQQWCDALEQNPHVQATTSLDELYLETVDIFLKIRPL
ncbi:hypothetical protein GGS20DRAFT_588811 [Poronia punctata]|nr:hypothetical protein GGS20DRAFT_588811 [Poronia punctata]